MLDSSALQQFRERGFVAVPGFFSGREVEAMRLDLERLKTIGRLRTVATEGDGETPATDMVNMQLCPMYRDSDLFRALSFHTTVVAAISTLIGDPFFLHLDQVFLKPGGQGVGTHWHQDNAYFKIGDPMRGTAMWIAIHDATVANGTMRVIDGSFREAYDHYRDPYSDHHIRCDPPEERAVTVELPAGGVLFFLLRHGPQHGRQPDRTGAGRGRLPLLACRLRDRRSAGRRPGPTALSQRSAGYRWRAGIRRARRRHLGE